MSTHPRKHITRHSANSGFTLMELLVAIAILTGIVGIVYASFASVTDTMDLARDQATLLRAQQFLWRQISTDLAAVYTDPARQSPEFQFAGVSADGAFGPMDSLMFCTSLPLSGGTALPGVLKVVQYTVVDMYTTEDMGEFSFEDDDDSSSTGPSMVLEITEVPLSPISEGDFAADPDVDNMKDLSYIKRLPIASFDVTYYDPEKEDWVEDWDSQELPILPWAVRVRANFVRSPEELDALYAEGIDPEESPDMDLTVVLPISAGVISPEPFLDPNHMRFNEMFINPDADTGTGFSTSDRDTRESARDRGKG